MIQLYTYKDPWMPNPTYFIYDTSINLRCSYAGDIREVLERKLTEQFYESTMFNPKYTSLLAEGPTLQDCINAAPELFI